MFRMIPHPWSIAVSCCVLIVSLGCTPDQEDILVEGEVRDQAFTATAGTAEELSSGEYVLTLSSSSDFTCTSQPEHGYLQVVLSNFAESGEYSATGNVTFNRLEPVNNDSQVNDQEGATSGRFFVDIFDDASEPYITGDLDAEGPSSRANGTFEVPICE